ncbi:hypothetical protein [Achromobacter xylosoxidans]|uniref:hypothetical protein n=1 Tax=Alcaligenes xylosoxydans xylosoxydans TaxID=85698 RepID=UPI00211AE1A5|nr:hypothetical protein [Achromobacter xylosoxidans]
MDSIVPTSMHASNAIASRCSRIIGNLAVAGMYPSGRLGAAIMQAMVWAVPVCTVKKILEAGPPAAPRPHPCHVNLFLDGIENRFEKPGSRGFGWYPLLKNN